MVVQADSTLTAIRKKVRRLTASSGGSSLTTDDIDRAINTFYSQDFPYGIKLDQMRSVYTFFTQPYIDRYPLDVNFNQGIRSPIYFEGIQGFFFKDRQEFFNMWPRWPTKFQGPSFANGTITAITQANPAQVTSTNSLVTGDKIYITDIVGMTQLNGNFFTVTVINSTTFTLNGIDSTAYGAYVSGGTWTKLNYAFTAPGPFLSQEVVLGGVDITGTAISINDNGNGILQYVYPNPVVPQPAAPPSPNPNSRTVPGMYNLNNSNPGLNNFKNIGAVDYVTGQFTLDFSLANVVPDTSIQMTLWVSQYQPGRPYSLLFWNNEFHIRPIPKLIHKVEVETYLTPVQFMETTDNPVLTQWWQYIAYGAACEILRERQDMEGLSNLMEGFKRQEALVLERQGIEEINQQNLTIYNNTNQNNGNWGNNFQGWY